MSFLIPCPHCGKRSVYEFRFGGEVRHRPHPEAAAAEWMEYTYTKLNESGIQKEWWFHRSGCRQWLQAFRDTTTNQVLEAFYPD